MTVYAKNNPVGVDEEILWFQNSIAELGWQNTDIYGRLYVNKKGKDDIAEAYIGGKDYKEVFIDDTKNAVFGFIVDGQRTGYTIYTADVKLICSLNLVNLFPNAPHRYDEEAISQVICAIDSRIANKGDIEIATDNDIVFSEVSRDRFKYRNMHPWFNFSVKFKLRYKN